MYVCVCGLVMECAFVEGSKLWMRSNYVEANLDINKAKSTGTERANFDIYVFCAYTI